MWNPTTNKTKNHLGTTNPTSPHKFERTNHLLVTARPTKVICPAFSIWVLWWPYWKSDWLNNQIDQRTWSKCKGKKKAQNLFISWKNRISVLSPTTNYSNSKFHYISKTIWCHGNHIENLIQFKPLEQIWVSSLVRTSTACEISSSLIQWFLRGCWQWMMEEQAMTKAHFGQVS